MCGCSSILKEEEEKEEEEEEISGLGFSSCAHPGEVKRGGEMSIRETQRRARQFRSSQTAFLVSDAHMRAV